MKKVILVITAAMLCPVILNAQNDKSFRLGLLVCPNMGWITTDAPEVENDGSHLGFRFGLLSDFKLGSSTNYFFSTGLFMNSMGAKLKTTLTDSLKTVVNSEVKLQYVELPITIKLKTNEIGYLTYFGQIGVNAGMRVSAKSSVSGSKDVDFADQANILRVALVVGGGLEYNFSGSTSAIVGLQYCNGFTDVFDSDAGVSSAAKLSYFELTLGALF